MKNHLSLKLSKLEQKFLQTQYHSVVGIDEVGRGCMAGPMVVCGYKYRTKQNLIEGINDSKKISAKKRESLYAKLIKDQHYIVEITPKTIDEIGLTKAFEKAVHQIYINTNDEKTTFFVDGNGKFDRYVNIHTIISGDSSIYSIAAASIIAKVHRDNIMHKYSEKYPQYGFERHVGYCTKEHIDTVQRLGILDIHRKSYKPIAKILGH